SQHAHCERISKYEIKSFILEQVHEIFHADPFLIEKRLRRFIVLESHRPAPNRQIVKNEQPDYEWQGHQIKVSLPYYSSPKSFLPLLLRIRGYAYISSIGLR